MRLYTVHYRRGLDESELILVKEGFSWPALFLTVVWALWHGLWGTALVLLGILVLLSVAGAALGLEPFFEGALSLAVSVLAGLLGNDLRRRALERKGFTMEAVVLGDDADSALRRFLDNHPLYAAGVRP
jgi:hypothetical protein